VVRRLARLVLSAVGVACLVLRPGPIGAGPSVDRLDRFRELAHAALTSPAAGGGEAEDRLSRELYALLDEEIVESLASGGVFASEAFLQDRLDAFNEAWGGAALQVIKTGGVVVAAVRLADPARGSSVRVYGGRRGAAALLAAIQRDASPTLSPMPPAADRAPQFAVLWEGATSGRGTTPVQLDLVRQTGDAVRTVWSTADLFGQDLQAWSYALRGAEVTLRYELQYPGWVPGCQGQTEQEDLYRYVAQREAFVLVERQVYEPWHRQFHALVEQFFAALRVGDDRSLARFVPDPRVRTGVPARLEPDSACDAVEGAPPATVSVAAALGPARQPWALTFRRGTAGWRLAAAAPVVPVGQ
jgi:hypothetical protein